MKYEELNALKIELTTNKEIIDSILNTPEIYQMINGIAYTKPINKLYREELQEKGFKFLSVYLNNVLIGLFSFREVTNLCTEAHIHILPEYHKKGYGKEAVKQGLGWFNENTSTKQIITYVPSNCIHVLKFMNDNQFVACGLIPKSIIYKTELVDLYLFQRGVE